METELCHLGYSISLKSLPPHFLDTIKSDLTVKAIENPNFPSNEPAFPIYRISKTKIYVPRFYGIEKYGDYKVDKVGKGESINLEFQGTLREVQQTTIDETMKHNFCGIISLGTGLGKTVVALKLISILKVKTLIIVHADFLLEQWRERIGQYLPTAKIGIIKQKVCDIEGNDIVIGMIQTIINREYPKGTFDSFGCMIIDETHHEASRTFSTLFFKVQPRYLLGLSATPERKDGLSKVFYWFLGKQIVFIKRDIGNPTIQFIMNDTTGYGEKFNRLGKVNLPEMLTDLSLKKERNEFILFHIRQLLKQDRKILLLSERREHCKYFEKILKEFTTVGLYLGGMKTVDRNISTQCNVILGTYKAAGEGFDVATLDTLILATPKSDVEQAVGRILRQKNVNEPLVLDIVDSFSIFKGQYYKRRKFYKESEFEIVKN